ncbi:hypothetical protein [Streptomyces pluripotens]|uniref:hypothetical protein n=1 Tax=Streptomyces pluripotens TaxID=1355015 RepID=UPI001430FEF2|nr:hypothetical protein [Streptomyces pluripotens]
MRRGGGAPAARRRRAWKRNYQSVYDNHYGPFFGNKPIGSVTPTIILEWEADQKERGYKETGINGRKNVLSSVFNYAVAAEIIGRNPCRKANPRRRSGQQVTPVTDEDIPTMEEVFGDHRGGSKADPRWLLGHGGLRDTSGRVSGAVR